MIEVLFIGGGRDGARIKVDEIRPEFLLHEEHREFIDLLIGRYEIAAEHSMRLWQYKAMQIRGEKETFWIYVEASMNPDDMVRKLIANYPKETK